ncbi:aspartate--tRNA ligase [Ferrimicrobium acidiphilum]|uniref:aspartate--tRNA ligase n=1 Tax=Ferrimicrobium acidiphilum TaxID=121039 RepID=UPI0023F54CE4|nr:aspartate--tRNA ligase [Ferrimicrobium acidiphilum]
MQPFDHRSTIPEPAGLRTAYAGSLNETRVGEVVQICGWVNRIREHGEHLVFVDVRDHTGVVQCVVPRSENLHPEWVVQITGTVTERPEGTDNNQISTGQIELRDPSVRVLAEAEPIPFSLDERIELDEATRLRYRYVDLRRSRMQRNLRLRSVVNSAIRRSMEEQGFTEIETPLLWTPTPEGAREFLVPSRTQPQNFYVLPQSPQIAKQLLMVAGFDRYYQIARCLRDEDLRADRQFEFTQLDLEASFVTQHDIHRFISHAIIAVVQAVSPGTTVDIDTITWHDAMNRYGSDKPDRRFGAELHDVTAIFADTTVKALTATSVQAMVAPLPLSRARLDELVDRAKTLGAKGLLWLRVEETDGQLSLNSPVSKFLTPNEQEQLITTLGAQPGDTILMVADEWEKAVTVLGQIRLGLGKQLTSDDVLDFFWVIDFPLFEGLDEFGTPISAHHPFTMPNEDDFALLDTDPLSVRSQSYDLVLNGWELGSGSIRIHTSSIQSKIFEVLGIDEETARSRFGFLLDAFKYGAPPHGGFAFGIDRLSALLAGEDNIRELIAFPKTQSGSDLMTGAPKQVDQEILNQLGLRPAARSKD